MKRPPFSPPHINEAHRWAGMRVGLLGGSFDPPHKGHVHISLAALKSMQLDYVWWLVSPQNPLKYHKPQSLDQRLALSCALIDHPRIMVSDLETQIRTQLTYDTVRGLIRAFPRTDFVWIAGMDNAQSFHKWNHWQRILEQIAMLYIARQPVQSLVRRCPARLYARQSHYYIDKSGAYDLSVGSTYWMMQKKMVDISSSDMRNNLYRSGD